jgi:hypothetical protein
MRWWMMFLWLDEYTELDFYIASTRIEKEASLGNIILMSSQPDFALTP